MAEDADPDSKTEEPSQRRLDEQAQQGNVPKSQEVGYWFGFFAITLSIVIFSAWTTSRIAQLSLPYLDQPHLMATDALGLSNVLIGTLVELAIAIFPILLLIALFGVGAIYLQNPPTIAWEKVGKLHFESLSPMTGLKRLLSMNSLVEFMKNLLKVIIVGTVVFVAMMRDVDSIDQIITMDIASLLPLTEKLVVRILVALLAIMFMIAGADYFYQRFQFMKKLRMTREEVKEEHKQQEGDPQVRARIRSLRIQRARKRMMQQVPNATVVVTNPTHYAVALQYDMETMPAPKIIAKGADLVAKRIRELAAENKVPIVENPPLARALFVVELDQEVPLELYKAVAEVISYVMRLKNGPDGQARRPVG